MSSMEELRQRIGVINGRIGQINDQRNKNIGMRESLTTQLNQSIADYQAKYGVDLSTAELVDAEYNRVAEEKEKEVKLIEDVISKIEAGDYSGANTLLGVEPKAKETEEVSQNVEPSVPQAEPAPSVPQAEPSVSQTPQAEPVLSVPQAEPVPSVTQTPQVEQSVPQAEPVPSVPQAPVAPSAPSMTPPPVPPAPTVGNLGGNAESFLEGFEKPAAPTGVTPPPAPTAAPSAPTSSVTPPPANPMSFDGILGGTQFQA